MRRREGGVQREETVDDRDWVSLFHTHTVLIVLTESKLGHIRGVRPSLKGFPCMDGNAPLLSQCLYISRVHQNHLIIVKILSTRHLTGVIQTKFTNSFFFFLRTPLDWTPCCICTENGIKMQMFCETSRAHLN